MRPALFVAEEKSSFDVTMTLNLNPEVVTTLADAAARQGRTREDVYLESVSDTKNFGLYA